MIHVNRDSFRSICTYIDGEDYIALGFTCKQIHRMMAAVCRAPVTSVSNIIYRRGLEYYEYLGLPCSALYKHYKMIAVTRGKSVQSPNKCGLLKTEARIIVDHAPYDQLVWFANHRKAVAKEWAKAAEDVINDFQLLAKADKDGNNSLIGYMTSSYLEDFKSAIVPECIKRRIWTTDLTGFADMLRRGLRPEEVRIIYKVERNHSDFVQAIAAYLSIAVRHLRNSVNGTRGYIAELMLHAARENNLGIVRELLSFAASTGTGKEDLMIHYFEGYYRDFVGTLGTRIFTNCEARLAGLFDFHLANHITKPVLCCEMALENTGIARSDYRHAVRVSIMRLKAVSTAAVRELAENNLDLKSWGFALTMYPLRLHALKLAPGGQVAEDFKSLYTQVYGRYEYAKKINKQYRVVD